MSQWNPDQYLKFADLRFRPGLDLLARIAVDNPATVYDLGCGTGGLTPALAGRWPEARIIGVDSSAEMLETARAGHPDFDWISANAADWHPDSPADVIYSNACLQWLDGHETLFPKLAGFVRPGGALAIQMPRNYSSPSHVCMREAATASPLAETLVPVLRAEPVAPPETYYDILRPHCRELDIWETVYMQVLEGDNPVAEWTRGTALKPLLDAIDDESEREAFFGAYSKLTQKAYPKRADGKTLFPFRRLFMVAQV